MSALRVIILVFGLLLIIMGISQLFLTNFWIWVSEIYVESAWLPLFSGSIAISFGTVLMVAIACRAVGLRLFVAILGILLLAGGAMTIGAQDFVKDLLRAAMLNRTHWAQVGVVWVAGIVRAAFGILLIYALRTGQPIRGQA